MKIWFDFTNPPHVNFYSPFIEYLLNNGYEVDLTTRDFIETKGLLDQKGFQYRSFGKHGGIKKFNKVYHLISREIKLLAHVNKFSYSISSNYEAPLASWLKHKPAIVFDDNDISPNWIYAKFAKHVVAPTFIDKEAMHSMGISNKKLICYDGYKEDIYIASYSPDPTFLNSLPFNNYITVRPENIQASYMPGGVKSIVPELLSKLGKAGKNVLYLPRYKEDAEYASNMDHVFSPNKPMNGLDVCYYSDAVLTGAGSFSREAAVIGRSAVSFFAGKKLLSVDKQMFSENKILHSREVDRIIEYVLHAKCDKSLNIKRSKQVQNDLFQILTRLLV